MYQLVSWGPMTCPGGYSQWNTFSIARGTILSIGFQNYGNALNFWATQAFVMNARQAFVQVANSSASGTQWVAWALVDTRNLSGADEDAEQLKGPESVPETQKYEGNGPA